jgi:hypothetical protein
MSAQPVDQHWFISLHGKRYGPYTFAALSQAAAKGVIKADTNVWRLGWVKWHPADRVPGLIEQAADPEGLDPITGEGDEQHRDDPSERLELEGEDQPAEETRPMRRQPAETAVVADYHSEGSRPGYGGEAASESPRGRKPRRTVDVTAVDGPNLDGLTTLDEEDGGSLEPRMMENARIEREAAPVDAGDARAAAAEARWGRRQRTEETDARIAASRWERRGQTGDDDGWVASRRKNPAGDDKQDDDAAPAALPARNDDGAQLKIGNAEAVARPEVPPQVRYTATAAPPRRFATGGIMAGVLAFALLAVAVGSLFYGGLIVMVEPRRSAQAVVSAPPQPAAATSAELTSGLSAAADLPQSVASLPAVVALQRNDPETFGTFTRRFADIAANAPDDQLPSLARSALRTSVKRLLANASGDTLTQMTDAYLAYMKALQSVSPETCVALSDESKGAKLTVNLARELPDLFAREMAVLERVASSDPHAAIVPPSAGQARSYLDAVYSKLGKQPVQTELLGRSTLTPAEFLPYCTLVIAFYETVLALPQDDRVNLLRYLYATAADSDADGQK